MVARQHEKGDLADEQSDTDSDKDSDGTDSDGTDSDGIDSGDGSEDEENEGSEKTNEDTSEEDINETPCTNCEEYNVNKTFIIRCPNCHWYEGLITFKNGLTRYDICQKVLPINRKTIKEALYQCRDCGCQRHVFVNTNFFFFYIKSYQTSFRIML